MFAGVYQKQVLNCCGGLSEILTFLSTCRNRMLFSSASSFFPYYLNDGFDLEYFGWVISLNFPEK